jgi:hypothetical protein
VTARGQIFSPLEIKDLAAGVRPLLTIIQAPFVPSDRPGVAGTRRFLCTAADLSGAPLTIRLLHPTYKEAGHPSAQKDFHEHC